MNVRFLRRILSHLAVFGLALSLVDCGGGGGGGGSTSNPPTQTTYTVTASAGAGTTATPLTQQVQSGQTAALTVGLLSGFSNLMVTGGGGTLSGNTYTTGPITANTNITTSATANPVFYTVTASVGIGTTATPATQQVQSGQTATLTVGLLSGYSSLVVTGGGGTLNGSTYTTGPITANTTITTSATANPVTYTVTANVGAGTTATPATQQVQSGQTATLTVGLLSGYNTLVVTGGGGTLNGSTYTTGPITANTTITTSATANPVYYTVIASVGTGTTATPLTQQVQSGRTTTLSVGLLPGYSNLLVTGGGGTLSGSTYTTGPITADTAVTTSATHTPITTVPAVTGKIAFVVAPDVAAGMPALLQQFMDAASVDAQCVPLLFTTFTDPMSIRAFLQANRADMRAVILIGQVPIIQRHSDDVSAAAWETTDHYYRALDFTFPDPVQAQNGIWQIPGVFTDYWMLERTFEYAPTIVSARITGLSLATQLSDIRAYLSKNLALRAAPFTGTPGIRSVDAFLYSGAPYPFNLPAIEGAYQNHPLAAPGVFEFVHALSAADHLASFRNGLKEMEVMKLLAHSNANSFLFEGLNSNDYLWVLDPSTLFDGTQKSRFVSFHDCHIGDFSYWGNSGMRAVMGGETLLARAAPYVAATAIYRDIMEANGLELALGVGRSMATSFIYTGIHEWEHFTGDPTIRLRTPDLSAPGPRLVVDHKAFQQEFALPLTLMPVSNGPVTTYSCTIDFENAGSTELIVHGGPAADYSTTATIDRGSGGRWAVYADGSWLVTMVDQYGLAGTLRIPPGGSAQMRFTLLDYIPSWLPSGTHKAHFNFTTNDPRIGSFRITATAAVP